MALAVSEIYSALSGPTAKSLQVVLAPGSYHLALLKLKSALKKGTKVSMTLEFEKAGQVTVPFDVLSAAATGPAAPPKSSSKPGADDGKMKK